MRHWEGLKNNYKLRFNLNFYLKHKYLQYNYSE